jgi:hypothetical protein
MSDAGTAAGRTIGPGAGRLRQAWHGSSRERRLAALSALGLLLTLFLPWFQETVIVRNGANVLQAATVSLTGWGAFSFAEVVIVLIVVGVLVLLFERAEGRSFHLPGGDGGVILTAGCVTSLLLAWRIVGNQGTDGHGGYATSSGIEWGIFLALAVSLLLAYSGSRIRAAREPEPPPRNGGDEMPFWGPSPAPPAPAPATPAAARPTAVAASAASAAPRRTRPPRPVAAPGSAAPTPAAADTTRVSEPRTPPQAAEIPGRAPAVQDGPPTRVSQRKQPARPFGEPPLPDDPPTMRLDGNRRPARADPDEQLTMPLDGHGDGKG